MRKPFLGSAFAMVLAAVAAGPLPAMAAEGTMVTGTVTSADQESGKVVINGETYMMDKQAGTVMMPAAGDKVSLTFRDEGGKKVVTRIGQATQ
jgi:Cu/Ag efflux protein CusF